MSPQTKLHSEKVWDQRFRNESRCPRVLDSPINGHATRLGVWRHGFLWSRLKHLAVDEIYVGKRKKFYTLVSDLEAGRIVWVGYGRGQAALGKLGRRSCSGCRGQAVRVRPRPGRGPRHAAVGVHTESVQSVFPTSSGLRSRVLHHWRPAPVPLLLGREIGGGWRRT